MARSVGGGGQRGRGPSGPAAKQPRAGGAGVPPTLRAMAERLLVIGGDAAGMSAASQVRRLRPDLDIVALEKGRWTSYSACGIPYVVGGLVGGLDELIARSPEVFRNQYRIDARTGHEAMNVDLDARSVEVRDHDHQRTYRLSFDLLHFATGAVPYRPALPGMDGP